MSETPNTTTESKVEEIAQLGCTNAGCNETATRVMALPPGGAAVHFVAPYCNEHAREVRDMGGLPVAGPALSEQAQKIGGIR